MSTHDAHADDHAAHAEGKDHHHHVTPLPVYFGVFGALMVLTAITVWIAQFDFGSATTLIAMLVATIKASLVALIFMHLLFDERLNAVAFGFGLIFVALFFIFTLADVLSRDYIDPVRDNGTMQSERVAALRVEYEQKFPVESAFAPVQPGTLIPADERDQPPAPTEAPEGVPGEDGMAPGQEGMQPVEGEQAIEGEQAEGAQPGDGAQPAEGAQPADGAQPDGVQPVEGAQPDEGAQVPPTGAADEGAAAMPAAPAAAPPAAAPAAAQPAEGADGEDDEAEQVPGDPANAREATRPAQPGGNVPGQQPSQPLNQPPVQDN